MAVHTITLTTGEESVYQKYLLLTGRTEEQVVASAKQTIVDQVLQTVNEAGHSKYDALSVADKLAFLSG